MELTEDRKKYIKDNWKNVTESTCPGPPQAGACEFCPGPCSYLYLDGKELDSDELDFIYGEQAALDIEEGFRQEENEDTFG